MPRSLFETGSRSLRGNLWTSAFLAVLSVQLAGCAPTRSDGTDETMLLPETIGDWVKQEAPVSYDRETIFDYINGAGEVYRSYAFSHVLVDRYETPEGWGMTVEVFDMGTAEDAFGVFSYAREQEDGGIGAGFERKGSVLCFWQDRYYVCVAAEQRDPDPGPALERVARGVSGVLPPPGERPSLVSVLPSEGLVPFSDRFFHLHQSLNYHFYLVRENVLDLTPATDAVLARYRPGPAYLLVIEYTGEAEAGAALSSFKQAMMPDPGHADSWTMPDGTITSTAQRDRYLVLVLNGPSEPAAAELQNAALENLTRIES